MRSLTFVVFLIAPMFSWAESCRFSRQVLEHSSVTSTSCAEKLCASVVVCDSGPKLAVCKAKAGVCDNFDADSCNITAQNISEQAQFQPSDWKEPDQASQGTGGR